MEKLLIPGQIDSEEAVSSSGTLWMYTIDDAYDALTHQIV